MSEETTNNIKSNLKMGHKWIRLLWMLLFSIIAYFALLLVFVITAFQFITKLFTNEINARLCKFGETLNKYLYSILQYITYETEQKPYPFNEWPTLKAKEPKVKKETKEKKTEP